MTHRTTRRTVHPHDTRTPRAARVTTERLEQRVLLSAGDLDTSFNGTGENAADIGIPLAQDASDVALQADGKTVVVAMEEGGGTGGDGFRVARFNLDGTLDTTFGLDHTGKVFTPWDSGNTWSETVAIQGDGKIVVAGQSDDDFAVARYNPNGTLDTSFDGDGKASLSFGLRQQFSNAADVFIQADGKILLGGTVLFGLFEHHDQFGIARFNADGSLDSSFDGDGHTLVDFDTGAELNSIAVDYSGTAATNPDYGKIVASGSEFQASVANLRIARLNPNGSIDNSFDGDGRTTIFYHGNTRADGVPGLVLQPGGKIVAAAAVRNADFGLVRLARDGSVDATFGPSGDGWALTDFGDIDTPTDLIQTPEGALIQLGNKSNTGRGVATKLSADGITDTSFGTSGQHGYAFPIDAAVYGPGRRFTTSGDVGNAVHAARMLDTGANLVYAATLNSVASEEGPVSRGFFVYRTERLPSPTRVYFSVGGTATAPSFRPRASDYTVDGMAFPNPILGGSDVPYVDIPANQTFAVVTITPVDDSLVEGNETATFTVRPDAGYEVGDPSTVSLTIVDNDSGPPTVDKVYVRGQTWHGDDSNASTTTFGEYLGANGLGDSELGFRVDDVPAGTTLPWINANQVVLHYTSPPVNAGIPTPGGVTLHGARSNYSVAAVSQLDPSTYVLTLDRALGNLTAAAGGGNDGDRVTLTVPGGGPAGSSYSLAINPLQGDADRAGGRVNAVDLGFVKARLNRTAGDPPGAGAQYTAFADGNGDGKINAIDLGAVKARLNHSLPPAFAAEAAPASLFGTRAIREDTRATALLIG